MSNLIFALITAVIGFIAFIVSFIPIFLKIKSRIYSKKILIFYFIIGTGLTFLLLTTIIFSLYDHSLFYEITPTPTPKYTFTQMAPFCNNPTGTTWSVPGPGIKASCSSEGLTLQSISNLYAQVELNTINEKPYYQNNFLVQVQIKFQNPNDSQTKAALIIQTPQGSFSGYIFTINSVGQWDLQQIISGNQIITTTAGSVNIAPSRPVTIKLVAQDKMLYGFINAERVVSMNNNLKPSPNQVGLLVEQNGNTSSPITFSNFMLET